jgi:hypothetical protein
LFTKNFIPVFDKKTGSYLENYPANEKIFGIMGCIIRLQPDVVAAVYLHKISPGSNWSIQYRVHTDAFGNPIYVSIRLQNSKSK